MRNIDYKLNIIGENKTYNPREEFIKPIIESDNKIFEITADNSYGKTFFLNLIAFGLETDKLDDNKVLRSIKEAVSRYKDETSYSLEYNIDLDLPDNKKLSLTKEINGGRIIRIDDGPPISHQNLHQELTIIYDVPTNPSERLNAVINDLNIWNRNLKEKFKNLTIHLDSVSREFDNVRDEGKIDRLRENLKEIKEDIKVKETSFTDRRDLIFELEKIKKLDNLSNLIKKQNINDLKFIKKEKQFKLLKKPAKIEKKDQSKINELHKELTELQDKFKSTIGELINQINGDSEILNLITNDTSANKKYELIKDFELEDLISSDIEKKDYFNKCIEYFIEHLGKFIFEKKNDKSYVIHNSYTQFVILLEQLVEDEIDYLLKKATLLDTSKLKNQLKELINKHKVKNYDNLNLFLKNDLKGVKALIAQSFRVSSQLHKQNQKQLANDTDNNYYIVQAELNALKQYSKEIKNQLNISRSDIANSMGLNNFNSLETLSNISQLKYTVTSKFLDATLLENINQSILGLNGKNDKLHSMIDELKKKLILHEAQLIREEKKNPSQYNEKAKQKIKTFLKMLHQVNANLVAYDSLISNIESGNLLGFKAEEDIKFMDLAGKIIAYSMDNKLLRADGEFVNLEYFDMLKQEFHCENNLIIKKADVSTGLASANYLKQRIENVDGKYVIILLDEIGNMAQNALNKVVDSIKKLESQNRLVLAVFTRPKSNGIEIIKY